MSEIRYDDRLNAPFDTIWETAPLFPTEEAALEAGRRHGWEEAIQLIGPSESCWVVGYKTSGTYRDYYRFPLLQQQIAGGERCPVLTVIGGKA